MRVFECQVGKAGRRPLRLPGDVPWSVAPSPSGDALSVVSFDQSAAHGSVWSLFIVPVGQVARRVATDWESIWRHAVVWSPDGAYLYFGGWRCGEGETSQIARIRTEDSHVETLVRDGLARGFVLSRDGRRLSYMQESHPDLRWHLWTLDTRTLQRVRLPDPPCDLMARRLAQSPRGDALAVPDAQGRLWRIQVPSGEALLVAEQGYMPLWLPKPGQGFVYFVRESEDEDSDVLMYHLNDAGAARTLVARL